MSKLLPDFTIDPASEFGNAISSLGIADFRSLADHVGKLPYGRNADRSKPELVLSEGKGTCSTKHAFLKMVAQQHGCEGIALVLGMYKMDAQNTPGIGAGLENAGLGFVPEAHCYLKWEGKAVDLTTADADFNSIQSALLWEEEIQPWQVGEWKVNRHKAYLEEWRMEHKLPFSFAELWAIREACIAQLSL